MLEKIRVTAAQQYSQARQPLTNSELSAVREKVENGNIDRSVYEAMQSANWPVDIQKSKIYKIYFEKNLKVYRKVEFYSRLDDPLLSDLDKYRILMELIKDIEIQYSDKLKDN